MRKLAARLQSVFDSHTRSISLLVLITVISRIPFLGAGYGTDPDAWRVANNALLIAETGIYTWSRPPGLPVFDLVSALLSRGGHWAINSVSAALSGLAVLFFSLSLRRIGIVHYVWAGLAFAFVPVVYIASTSAIDYVWALAFIMLSLYFCLGGRPIVAGLFLGLAIGCRLTSGAMLLPLLIVLATTIRDNPKHLQFLSLGTFGLSTAIVAALTFMPVILNYGPGFFTFYELPSPSLSSTIEKLTFGSWGVIGTMAVVATITATVLFPRSFTQKSDSTNTKRFVRPAAVAVALYLVAFLRLPAEAGYLIPLIPFVLLLVALYVRRWVMIILVVAIVVTPFVDFPCPTCIGRPGPGRLITDYESRKQSLEYVDAVLAEAAQLSGNNVVVAAWWEPHLLRMRRSYPNMNVEYVYFLDSSRLIQWQERGYSVFYLPTIADYNRQLHDVDLRTVGNELIASEP